jgi:hypothetical protein
LNAKNKNKMAKVYWTRSQNTRMLEPYLRYLISSITQTYTDTVYSSIKTVLENYALYIGNYYDDNDYDYYGTGFELRPYLQPFFALVILEIGSCFCPG